MGRNVVPLPSAPAAAFPFLGLPDTDLSDGHATQRAPLEGEWLACLDASPCVTIVADLKGRVCFVNTEGRAVIGAAATEALLSGRALSEAFAWDCRKLIMEEGIPTAIRSGVWHGEAVLLGQQRSATPVALSISARSPAAEWLVCVAADISQQKDRERQLEHLATHDALTGLPNFALFTDRLARELHVARRNNRPFAVMFLDIDRFKELNDRIGHERANRLLAELAVRLHSCVRAIDTVARYGGDEFAIILTNLNDAAEANAVIKRVRAATVEPFSVLGKHVDLSVSIGVAMFPSDAGDGESLVMAADRDMYRCKRLARRARRAPATEPAALGQRRAVANSPHDRAWA